MMTRLNSVSKGETQDSGIQFRILSPLNKIIVYNFNHVIKSFREFSYT